MMASHQENMSEEPLDPSDASTLEAGGTEFERRRRSSFLGIHAYGESGRSGIHISRFLRICFTHSAPCRFFNLLWVVVPAAIIIVRRHETNKLEREIPSGSGHADAVGFDDRASPSVMTSQAAGTSRYSS